MQPFQALTPQVQINGETVLAMVGGTDPEREEILCILAKTGIVDPRPGEWYPQQAWLDAFRILSGRFGAQALREIGERIIDSAKFPPRMTDVHQGLTAVDIAYHKNHRGGEIGYYRYQETGERSGRMECWNPYPCAFDLGIIEAILKRFVRPSAAEASVSHFIGSPCRQDGGHACLYEITW